MDSFSFQNPEPKVKTLVSCSNPNSYLLIFAVKIIIPKPRILKVVLLHCIHNLLSALKINQVVRSYTIISSRGLPYCISSYLQPDTRISSVKLALEIPSTNLIQASQLRDNLQLSVSMSGNRMKDLMALLKSSPYAEVQSIIIYCKFQSETDMISKFLRDSNILAKSYHSGLPAKVRSRTQELFCSNKIRVVVATVAFGMGLDKSDVGAVIHYSFPESLEKYVQEIGRAGRDGRLSYCHIFFDDITYFKLRSLMYNHGVDEYTVNRFLSHIFSNEPDLHGKVHSLVKESASRKFDMKEEIMMLSEKATYTSDDINEVRSELIEFVAAYIPH